MELVLQSSATNNKSEFALALNMFLISDTSGNFTSDRDRVRGVQYLWQPRGPRHVQQLCRQYRNRKGEDAEQVLQRFHVCYNSSSPPSRHAAAWSRLVLVNPSWPLPLP